MEILEKVKGMHKTLGLFLTCIGLAACSREPDRSDQKLLPEPGAEVLVIKVDGMIKAEGGKT